MNLAQADQSAVVGLLAGAAERLGIAVGGQGHAGDEAENKKAQVFYDLSLAKPLF